MPDPTPTPAPTLAQKLGPGILKFGKVGSEKEFQSRTTATKYKPELTLPDRKKMLDHSTFQGEGEWGGSISGSFFQEYSMTGLLAWCLENAGTEMPFTFTPLKGAGNMQISGTCVIMPVEVGGDPDKTNETEFEFPVNGKATISAASA